MKKDIIPTSLKLNIDEVLEKQLFNANRYFAETNKTISKQMDKEIKDKSVNFLFKLKNRWNWHNMFYEYKLEPAYELTTKYKLEELSPIYVEFLSEIYKTCCLVDNATLIMSGAIKKHLQYHIENPAIQFQNVENFDINIICTPPENTFFSQYKIDHIMYIYLKRVNVQKSEEWKKYLLKQYHIDDELIFNTRLKKIYEIYDKLSTSQLIKEIDDLTISDDYKLEYRSFVVKNPKTRAFTEIVKFDNVDEKLIAIRLIGISGFLFRKYILSILNESKILKNDGYIYQFTPKEIGDALNILKNEKEIRMEKNIHPYKQKGMTCAISCMLMVLEYYGKLKANALFEKDLYRKYRSKIIEGTPLSAVAFHFAKVGFNVDIVHSEKKYFSNEKKLLDPDIFEKSMIEYTNYIEWGMAKGVKSYTDYEITADEIRKRLKKDELIILSGQLKNVLHAVLVCGYENEKFIVCDPLCSKKTIMSQDELIKFSKTDIGQWFVSVHPLINKEEQELRDCLEKFQTESKNFIDGKELD